MQKKVLVVMGGFSSEREVSLVSGKGVCDALTQKGYNVIPFTLNNVYEFIEVLKKEKPDAVFNALHGNWGEDGEIQALLDLLQIPYTHSGMKASVLGMDKALTKLVCERYGIKVAKGEEKTFGEYKKFGTQIKIPYVVKPASDGSSVGVFIVKNEEDAKKVFYEDDAKEIIIEEFIDGHELTCAVLNGKALAVTEMQAKCSFYDYTAKYTDGMTMHVLPAPIPENATKTCMAYAEKLHQKLGCKMLSRCDFRYNEKDGVVLLEINTAPGMTPLSLVPEQAKYCGISYADLCAQLVENAECRHLEWGEQNGSRK